MYPPVKLSPAISLESNFAISTLLLSLSSRLTHLLSSGSSSTSLSIGGRYYINNLYAGCDLVLAEPTTLKFNAGYAIFINDQLAIEPSLTYSKINEFTSSLSMMVGFAMYL